MPIVGTPIPVDTEVAGYFTAKSAVERRYGKFNVDDDADLENDGSGTAAVWAEVMAETDADFDRELRRRGYSRPSAPSASKDYAVLGELARDWARVKLYYARGWGDVGGAGTDAARSIAGKFAKLHKDTWQRLVELLDLGIDFPQAPASGRPEAYVAPGTFTSVPAVFGERCGPHRGHGW